MSEESNPGISVIVMLGEGSQTSAWCNTSFCEQATGRLRSELLTPGSACRHDWTQTVTAVCFLLLLLFWLGHISLEIQRFLAVILEFGVVPVFPFTYQGESTAFAVLPWPSLKAWLPSIDQVGFVLFSFQLCGLLQQDIFSRIFPWGFVEGF